MLGREEVGGGGDGLAGRWAWLQMLGMGDGGAEKRD